MPDASAGMRCAGIGTLSLKPSPTGSGAIGADDADLTSVPSQTHLPQLIHSRVLRMSGSGS